MSKHRILFVCLGNICRSSTAQTIMQHMVDQAGLTADYEIDSAGLISYHQGEPADRRMREHAWQRGYRITHLSRPIRQVDFMDFDLVIGMDTSNIEQLRDLAPTTECEAKVHRMTEYCRTRQEQDVPDPYYGGWQGFELVLDILEDACAGLLHSLE